MLQRWERSLESGGGGSGHCFKRASVAKCSTLLLSAFWLDNMFQMKLAIHTQKVVFHSKLNFRTYWYPKSGPFKKVLKIQYFQLERANPQVFSKLHFRHFPVTFEMHLERC